MGRRVRVIGCGNPDAGDDALGLMALDQLRAWVPEEVELCRAGPAVHVLDLLEGIDTAILIDAVRTGSARRDPGTLVRAEGGALISELRGSLSSHGFGLAESVALAEAMGSTCRFVFHGIEATTVEIGAPLSDAVARALPKLVEAVIADIDAEVPA